MSNETEGEMHINEVRKLAKKMNINSFGIKKKELIRSIQRAENAFDCFATERLEYCNEHICLWREDCTFENKRQSVLNSVHP